VPTLVYFDQNCYDYLLDHGYPTEGVRDSFRRSKSELVISGHSFQEWAACWKSGNRQKEARGQALLGYLQALEPDRLLVEIPDLLRYEVGKLFGRRLPGPWLPAEDVANAKALITRFARGEPTAADQQNIARNWQSKEWTRDLQHAVATLGAREQAIEPTFEAFVVANRNEAEKIGTIVLTDALRGFHPGGRRDDIINFALRRWRKCPTLAAAIRANLFINRAVRSGTKLRHDCWDDLKHCVNAAHVDVFVTGDHKLTEIFREIRPGPRIAGTEDSLRKLGLSS
jgi:hypothetical protein